MRNIFYAIVIIYGIVSCKKITDDSRIPCTKDCTTFHGYFITANGETVQNVKLQLNYRISRPPGPGETRIIRNTKSNDRGYFNMNFFILDSELGDTARGFFQLDIDLLFTDLNKYLIEDFKFSESIYSINRRDTIISNEFYLPAKSYIKVNLKNFIRIKDDDYFEVRILYPYGFINKDGYNDLLDSKYQTGNSFDDIYLAKEPNTSLRNVRVSESTNNVIRVSKRKDGVYSSEDFKIFVPKNNKIELDFEY